MMLKNTTMSIVWRKVIRPIVVINLPIWGYNQI